MSLEKILADLIQKVERRFYGKYRGIVVDNADPENLGRLKVKVPSVLGSDVATGWALPCVPYGGDADLGFLFIPEVNGGVWVEFEEGDLEFPVWVGTFWSKPGGDSELPKPDKPDGTEESAVQDPPTRKIIKTKKGHTVQFEDADNDEMVLIKEAVNGHVISMNKDGIKVTDGKNGHTITLDNSGITITDGVNSGNRISMDSNGLKAEDKNSNAVVLESAGVTVKGSQIKIGDGASEPLVLGNQLNTALMQWINSVYAVHMHTGNLGAPTTPPVPGAPLNLASAMSQTNTVK